MSSKRNALFYGLTLVAASLLAHVPARAETPAYVGTWATDIAQCQVEQDRAEAPLVLKEKRFDQHETHCTFKSVSGEMNDWNVKADCKVEGSSEPYDFMLTVSGNTLTITDEAGGRDLLRCQ